MGNHHKPRGGAVVVCNEVCVAARDSQKSVPICCWVFPTEGLREETSASSERAPFTSWNRASTNHVDGAFRNREGDGRCYKRVARCKYQPAVA